MEWELIPDFPDYSVSDLGRIRNNRTGRLLVLTRNAHGIVQVGLMDRGVQYKRSVAKLVAEAFLAPPQPSTFDTPINLDGDRCNNAAHNLMWRPRWFAVSYHRQFRTTSDGITEPIVETHTGLHFKNSWHAAVTFGLLDREIFLNVLNQAPYVWPTYQNFRTVDS